MGFAQKLLFIFLFCSSISLFSGVESSSRHHHHHRHHHGEPELGPKKLFVFGDSYADTGNDGKLGSNSWEEPYGITFPGKPSGRFSDGRVLTDFLARSLGLKSPVAYKWLKYAPQKLKYGVNFAFGGTGVFDTLAPYPNMTTQIDFFQHLLNDDKALPPSDLQSSVALVTLAGNDYSNYLSKGGSEEGLQTFIPQVVNQLVVNLERIHGLGVKKIAVTSLQPLGCLPRRTVSSWFQQCNSTDNKATNLHNLLLQQAAAKLNNQTHGGGSSPFVVVLDLFGAFLSAFQQREPQSGSLRFNSPLKPCCMGVNQNYVCGSVDAWGNKMYTVCQDPQNYFFWVSVHPTQAGWHAVSMALQPTLEEMHYS